MLWLEAQVFLFWVGGMVVRSKSEVSDENITESLVTIQQQVNKLK